jgi:hypothetical protein
MASILYPLAWIRLHAVKLNNFNLYQYVLQVGKNMNADPFGYGFESGSRWHVKNINFFKN